MRVLRRTAACAAAAVLVGGLVWPAAAQASPAARPAPKKTGLSKAELRRVPTVTPAVLALMKKQDALLRVADDVRARAPRTGATGLSGLVLAPKRNALRLYWHGAVPAGVRAVITAARGRGITVTTHQAPYTERRLQSEIARMSARPLSTGSSSARRALELAAKPDGSGIIAVVSGLPSGTGAAKARQMVPALDTGLPVAVSTGPRPEFSYRFLDTPPYWGGAYIDNAALATACSDAFGVTGNNGASTYMFTAAHCGTGTWTTGTVTSGGTTYRNTIGSTFPAGRSTGIDAELLLPPSGFSDGGSVYYGAPINPPNGDLGSNTGIPVTGSGSNAVGAYVCTDGSFSGTICNVQVQLTNITITYSPAENGVGTVTHLVQAYKAPSGGVYEANGNGDSGGPVIIVFGDGTARAQGIISGMRTGSGFTVPCTGYTPSGRVCSNTVFYADLNNAMSTLGVHLNTD